MDNLKLLNNINQIKEIVNKSERLFYSEENYYDKKKKITLEQETIELLNLEKPKIMVAGIYSAGKSTLINVLCRKDVAEVSARPQTDKITEYDYNDYILVDSPGVDAPIKYEEITNEYVSKCHILLFVISTGMFESVSNYSKMYEWIKTGKPFIIVVNDKKGYKDFENFEIAELKNKIIKNLRKFSNNDKIIDKFDVIVVNAKRAETAIKENKKRLYELSNLEMLEERISRIALEKNEFKLIITPINNMIKRLDEFEEFQTCKVIPDFNNNFNGNISMFHYKRNYIIDDVKIRIRSILDSKINSLINIYVNSMDMTNTICDDIKNEIEQLYKAKISELILFIKSHFKDIELSVSENSLSLKVNSLDIGNGENLCINSQENFSESNLKFTDDEESDKSGMGLIGAGAAASFVIANPIPVIIPIAIKLIDKFLSKEKEEQKRYETLLAQAEKLNKKAEKEANEKLRIKQDIRIQVESRFNNWENSIINQITDNINSITDNVVNQFINISKENELLQNDVMKKIKTAQELKNQLNLIKNRID